VTTVSVLIPAFRPTFLGQAIASVLAQGHEDFELIVSDDSGGDELLPVVERFRDPRIRYVKTPGRTGGAENMRTLWALARHDLLKYLFDDDVMLPHALGELVDEAARSPQASFVFGRRHKIDARGRVLEDAPTFAAERAQLSRVDLARELVGGIRNPIGEFSNVLINRALAREADFLAYKGLEMKVVTDVGFFLNAASRAPAVGLSRLVGAFRVHADQASSPAYNPWFAVGLGEWEMFIRGELNDGALTSARALEAIDKLAEGYVNWSRAVPVIAQLTPGLRALRERVEAGETEVFDDAFRARWTAFVQTVADLKAARERGAAAGT